MSPNNHPVPANEPGPLSGGAMVVFVLFWTLWGILWGLLFGYLIWG